MRLRVLSCLILVLVCLALAGLRSSWAQQDKPASGADDGAESIDQLASELSGVPAQSPEETLHSIQLAEGFRAELVAAEPLVRDPVAIDFDEYGRMFVAELPQYNAYAKEGSEAQGSIRLLEDTNGDGMCDRSSVYANNLDYPTAVTCWDGGLFVGAAPDLLYLKDTDGDGRADTRDVVFTGFGKDAAGEAHLNSFRWGADNRFHFSTNLSGGEISVAANPDFKPVSVRGRGIIFDPRDLTKFELTSGGGQHGMSMDNWGHKFVCSNSVPAQMLMYDDRYLVRNPLTRAAAAAVDIAPEGKFTRLFRISPDEPWRKLRTRLRKDGLFRGSDEGGQPFGFFTGATGVTIYRGDAWPQQYHGNLLVGDVANNLIYRAQLEWDALRPVARRADPAAEFLASRDIWFRPVQMANAPDGTLYVLDMYRELIEGAAFLPPEFVKYIDPVGGSDRGRIYRIAPDGFRSDRQISIGQASTQELIALLDHANGWHRDTASRLLYQRQDPDAVPALRKMCATAGTPEGRSLALHCLKGLGALDESLVLAALTDPAPLVRGQALQLAESVASASSGVVAAMCAMTLDEDLRVRYQLAFSLGAVSSRTTALALARISAQDGADPWIRLAVLTSLKDTAGLAFARLGSNDQFRTSAHGADFLLALAEQIGTTNRRDEVGVVLNVLQALPPAENSLARQLVEALVKNQKGDNRSRILAAAGGQAGEILEGLLSEAKETAIDQDQPLAARVEAVSSLKLAPFEEVQTIIERLLDLREAVEIQSAVLQALGEYDEAIAAEMILRGWRGYSPAVRAEAAETLLSRPGWIISLLTAMESGELSRSDLDSARAELLKKHPDQRISALAVRIFGDEGLSRRAEVIADYQPALAVAGDVQRGQEVFKKTCSACHRLEGIGTAIGADLKAVRNRGLPAVMLNILDPNREVKPQFLAYVLITVDGRTVTGMIQEETANSLTIRRPDGTSVEIPRAKIDELASTGLSFMPEGLEKQIDVKSMADLLAYLDSIR